MSQQQQHDPHPARVLVADDDFSIRQLVCTIVRREGLEVDCAADGAEAIEKLREHDYAVILLDLMMPRVDGFGVIEHLRQHMPERKPVVLVITAYADQKFKEVDPMIVAGVIRKPFEVADLGNLVRLCVHGFDDTTRDLVISASDRAIRDLASRQWDQASGNGNGAH
ncbi:MAG TPA: response regulator [Thermoanaerobaculia bacterium]|nr:response regulator [Thermoanaerobaculia bacterium]